jgi:hypothetical protein
MDKWIHRLIHENYVLINVHSRPSTIANPALGKVRHQSSRRRVRCAIFDPSPSKDQFGLPSCPGSLHPGDPAVFAIINIKKTTINKLLKEI